MIRHFLIFSLLIFFLFTNCYKSDFSRRTPNRWEQRAKADEILRETAIHNNSLAAKNLLSHMRIFFGTPHKMGGTTVNGVDCSGLVQTIFKRSLNIELPHNTTLLFEQTTPVHLKQAQLGDLVFFATNKEKVISHVGIYLHDDWFVHASSVNGVTVSNLKKSYYRKRFRGVRRVANINLN